MQEKTKKRKESISYSLQYVYHTDTQILWLQSKCARMFYFFNIAIKLSNIACFSVLYSSLYSLYFFSLCFSIYFFSPSISLSFYVVSFSLYYLWSIDIYNVMPILFNDETRMIRGICVRITFRSSSMVLLLLLYLVLFIFFISLFLPFFSCSILCHCCCYSMFPSL